MAHLHSFGTWPEPGGQASRDYQAGTALLAAAISVFVLSELPMLYWTVDPRATGFYAKFFERYGPMLRWLDISRTQMAGETEGEAERVILFRDSALMRELPLSRS